MKHIHCPANGWDCPNYSDDGHPCRCTLSHPEEECDDFLFFWDLGDDWFDDDWDPCDKCGNADQDTTTKVASCNCCETAEYYYTAEYFKKKPKKGLTNFL